MTAATTTTTATTTSTAPKRRRLSFVTEDGVLAEVARLRRHGYHQHGNWSLAQIAWHLAIPLENYLTPLSSPDVKATPEQAKLKANFVDYIVANNALPPFATTAPPSWTPPADAGDADIERFIAAMNRLKDFPHPMVDSQFLGPLTIFEFRRLQLVHAAHHLSFLEPNIARREDLRYNSPDDVIADINKLRHGHKQAGDWTLPQACWHLNVALGNAMRPGPHADQLVPDELRARLARILSSGQMPQGAQAPQAATPPPDTGDAAVDDFIATMRRWKSFPGDFAPHRLFGKLNDDDTRRLAMIHCAHHVSFFVPTTT